MSKTGKTVYDVITDQIIQKLEAGTIPWRRMWQAAWPANYISKREYRGINVLLLGLSGYKCPYWVTWRQIEQIKARLPKGAKSSTAVFWKPQGVRIEENEETGEETTKRLPPILRYYRVWNLEQL